mmetsp:Transcript_54162/g.118113  ORF Transcript_54162/g.118113 Transcript_54162/m.118113 type:complete len:340 (-) Transcript_54162:460-1479(-)
MLSRNIVQRRASVVATRFAQPARLLRVTRSALAQGSGLNNAPLHFRNSPQPHPLGVEKPLWVNPTVNHVWSEDEVKERLATQPRHTPTLLSEKILNYGIKGLYWAFNKATGYVAADPTPNSIITRLLFLESIAGVPGMVAAQHRHFASLRNMSRDYGWIHTLLEEAENERMHLLTFIHAFEVTSLQRAVVFGMQFGWAGFFIPLYVLSPRTAHRSVGYIEEMAVYTYSNIIQLMDTPGTKLHEAWSTKEAPEIAKVYWRMDDKATFMDVIKQIAVDETNHRDVNHTFAEMQWHDVNPYVNKHIQDAGKAYDYWKSKNDAVEGKNLDYLMNEKPEPKPQS